MHTAVTVAQAELLFRDFRSLIAPLTSVKCKHSHHIVISLYLFTEIVFSAGYFPLILTYRLLAGETGKALKEWVDVARIASSERQAG